MHAFYGGSRKENRSILILQASLSALSQANVVLMANHPQNNTESNKARRQCHPIRSTITIQSIVAGSLTIRVEHAMVIEDHSVE